MYVGSSSIYLSQKFVVLKQNIAEKDEHSTKNEDGTKISGGGREDLALMLSPPSEHVKTLGLIPQMRRDYVQKITYTLIKKCR